MFKTGLVSVSFRKNTVEEIITLVKESGIDGIEWGGDIHVPAGNIEKAVYTKKLCEENGIEISAYGSYYKVGEYGDKYKEEFAKVLDTAVALGAPIIRVWAGVKGSNETTEEKRRQIISESNAISELSAEKNIKVAFECHMNTLTDDYRSALALLNEIKSDNIYMYWQPNQSKDVEYNLKAAEVLSPFTTNIHVFNWPDINTRLPLCEAEELWIKYLSFFNDEKTHYCALEFMPDGSTTSLEKESRTLNNILKKLR